MVGAIIGIIVIAIIMFIVFYVASPRFRNKVRSLGHKLRMGRRSSYPDAAFEPLAENAFTYCQLDDAQEMNINKGGRRTSAYGAELTTAANFVDDGKETSINSNNVGSELSQNRDDEFLVL